MNLKILAAACAGVLALSACETSGGGYAQSGYGQPTGGTHLSRCGKQALVGAGIGAVAGALIGSENNRGENALLGAAVGGGGTYGVCSWMSARERDRVDQAYYNSLNNNREVSDAWQSDQGAPRSLVVTRPVAAQGYGAECRQVSATVRDPQHGDERLPPETFCRNARGDWAPA
jgi:YMGG-like Gly-zipper